MDKATAHLGQAFPLETPEWTAWSANKRTPRLAGRWALSGHQLGSGPVYGEVVITAGAPGEFTTETTFLGAHLLPAEYEGRADEYIQLVCGPMLDAAAPHSRWIDAFCETGAFDADQCRAVLAAGQGAGGLAVPGLV